MIWNEDGPHTTNEADRRRGAVMPLSGVEACLRNLGRGMRTVGSLSSKFGNVSKHGNKG